MRRIKRLRAISVLVAVGTVASAAAPVTWKLLGHDRVIPPKAVLQASVDQPAPRIDVLPVLSFAPFGAPPTPETASDDTNATPLNLRLLGVIVRDNPERSLALIAGDQGEANYRIGDTVGETATLRGVFEDFVTIDVNGQSRKLTFDGDDGAQEADGIPTGQDRLAAIMATGQGTTISAQNDAAQRAVPVTTQDYIDLWRDRIRANPAEVLDAIGLVPTENGYMIAEKHDSGVNRAGLKAGDIVRTLNGQPVGDIDRDSDLYDEVAESGLARIELERNGRTIVMSFPLE